MIQHKSDIPSTKRLSLKITIPVIIGLGVVVWLFHDEFSEASLKDVHFSTSAILAIVGAWIFMIGRDFGLTWRFREITDHHLSWGKALKVNMLCEFTSAVTPTSVGGSTLGMVYMHREGVEWGRSATLMMTTLFLDELYFVIACPVIFMLVPYDSIFGIGTDPTGFIEGLQTVFWLIYGGLTAWTILLFCGVILWPHAVRKLLIWVFSLPLIRRWKTGIEELGDNMVATSADLRKRRISWWLKVFGATAISWCSRFLVINMLFLGFVPDAPQGVVFSRQFIVWVVLMISPTPGGSGVSEWLFKNYYGDLIANGAVVMVVTLFWRLISYYVYLVVGAVMMPRWFSDGAALRKKRKLRQNNHFADGTGLSSPSSSSSSTASRGKV